MKLDEPQGRAAHSPPTIWGPAFWELQVGWRYTRSGRAARRNGFLSFISAISMAGIAVGVAALIIVLSVMNGFQKEVRARMLSVVAHIEVMGAGGAPLADWQTTAVQAARHPEVRAAAPFIASAALAVHGDDMSGVLVRGISPEHEARVTQVAEQVEAADLQALVPGGMKVILGSELARNLHVKPGDQIALAIPGGSFSTAGVMPQLKRFTVAGLLHSGHYQYDSTLALVQLDDAAQLFGLHGVSGVQLRLADLDRAREVGYALQEQLGPGREVRDWTPTNQEWFSALQIQKRLLFIILALIIGVASFNLVSTLVMTVKDKRADIAILRTLGASPASVMAVFMVQGCVVGAAGTLAGVVLGLLASFNIDLIVGGIERVLQVRFLDPSIYLITRMPSDPQGGDIIPIVAVSLTLAFLSTLYPSWRASRVQPAQALRYE